MQHNNSDTTNGMFDDYSLNPDFLDEVFSPDGAVKPAYAMIIEQLSQYSTADLAELYERAHQAFFEQGITFKLPSDKPKTRERVFPFDLLPRLINSKEWEKLERGAIQRNMAINAFIHDVYHQKHIFKDKLIPQELVTNSVHYSPAMVDLDPPGGIYNHISGTDLVKHSDGEYYILEDNVRTPSGMSYVLSNREVMKRTMFQLFGKYALKPVKEFTEYFLTLMRSVAPAGVDEPNGAVLTDGMQASAYFEHAYMAHSMGVPLVEGKDLYVEKDKVYMKTVAGPKRIDVMYRRLDDEFLDPEVFNADSVFGIPGIMKAYRKGNINMLNAPGCGAADDKAVYSYVPAMIRYYLGEEPILNNVHTYLCSEESDYKYVIENMDKLVIKPVDEYGGKGILVGSAATKAELSEYKQKIAQDRSKYIAQPIMSLSNHATYIEGNNRFEPRHVDLRTYTLLGKDMQYVLQGGLTRVALTEGNMIVNSSQGGGSKDTWVLEE
ncbi:circularly permuted type 2 ATP-grasp protein [Pontibacter diazotrophicus]|uniref:Circularly permuted type 2 ATP-grasp protein n=1 Tax=Pontibacter diazotrophicus TaxID=1400979 RepID=A0A3D8LDK3_9BACT|nr:circularly permuted type 2 ATP-grasp protein [Pontibacter diazotrophicus]RDV15354.1 circularly permuted type 2 ATP-grasp protein [Pontibacter diazotrophicus]